MSRTNKSIQKRISSTENHLEKKGGGGGGKKKRKRKEQEKSTAIYNALPMFIQEIICSPGWGEKITLKVRYEVHVNQRPKNQEKATHLRSSDQHVRQNKNDTPLNIK